MAGGDDGQANATDGAEREQRAPGEPQATRSQQPRQPDASPRREERETGFEIGDRQVHLGATVGAERPAAGARGERLASGEYWPSIIIPIKFYVN